MKLALFIVTSVLALSAQAETLYTKLEDTVVRDKPVALGSKIVSHLRAGSMVETVKQVGAFTAVSYIAEGKVRTGFIQTSQIQETGNQDVGAVETAQTAVGSEDVGSMINGLSNEPAPKMAAAAANGDLPEGAEDPAALITTQLDSMQVPAKDLATFASNGKLVARKPKGR